jgi:TPR repeat protein
VVKAKAAELWAQAAEQSDACGQFALGFCHNLDGVDEVDITEAVQLFRQGAEKGHGIARKLKTCSKCRVARFCDMECTAHMCPAHMASSELQGPARRIRALGQRRAEPGHYYQSAMRKGQRV